MLTSRLTLAVRTDLEREGALATARAPLDYVRAFAFGAETDLIFHDTRTLVPSGQEPLILGDGSLPGPFGQPLAFARVNVVLIAAAPGNVHTVNLARPILSGLPIFPAPGNGTRVRPGGVFVWVAPGGLAAGGGVLQVLNGGGGASVTFDLIIIGASA